MIQLCHGGSSEILFHFDPLLICSPTQVLNRVLLQVIRLQVRRKNQNLKRREISQGSGLVAGFWRLALAPPPLPPFSHLAAKLT